MLNILTAPPEGGTATYRLIGLPPSPVLRAPVSYELLEVRVTPSGQTQITDIEKLQRFWRDSKGRTRLEQFHIGPRLETNPRLLICPVAEVLDPVAGSWYVLELEKKIAHRSPLPPPAPTPPSVGVMSAFPPGAEDLGTQTINGVPAQGQRITSTVPADAQGDDRPLVHEGNLGFA